MAIVQMAVKIPVPDFTFYPRNKVDSEHVARLVESCKAGAKFPPLIIDKRSKRIIDGFHRQRMYIRVFGEDHVVDVDERTYRNDAEMFKAACTLAKDCKRALDKCDRTRCLILADQFGVPVADLAGCLNVTVDYLADLKNTRVAVDTAGDPLPLKSTVRKQFVGQTLTPRQVVANKKLSGMQQVFYVNQVIELFESDMLDKANLNLVERLKVLKKLLKGI